MPARVDPAVARLSKRSFFPADDSALLRDPMDRRLSYLEIIMYQGALNKAAIASVPVSRAVRVWLSHLWQNIQEGVPRDNLAEQVYSLKMAADFFMRFFP